MHRQRQRDVVCISFDGNSVLVAGSLSLTLFKDSKNAKQINLNIKKPTVYNRRCTHTSVYAVAKMSTHTHTHQFKVRKKIFTNRGTVAMTLPSDTW